LSLQINTFDDLLYIINTHPEWRQRLVKALFPEIDISKALAELVESNRLMRAQLGNVEERLAQLDARQNRMETHQDRMETHLVHIDGRLTNVEADIVIIKKDVTTLKGDTATLKGDVGTLKGDVATLKGDVATLKGDVGTLKGYGYETNIKNKADSIFGYGLRRGRDHRSEISAQLDAAEQSGLISEDEYIQVLAADLLWSGRHKRLDKIITLVVESSWFAKPHDIDRVVSRATILRRIGVAAFPVVAAREWLSATRQLALVKHVIIVDDHGLDKISWDTATA
jgi:hypothetical protein